MRAYELADLLDVQFGNPKAPALYDNVKEAVELLRVQADQIEQLQSVVSAQQFKK